MDNTLRLSVMRHDLSPRDFHDLFRQASQNRADRAARLLKSTDSWRDDAPEQNNIDSSNFLSDPTNRRRTAAILSPTSATSLI